MGVRLFSGFANLASVVGLFIAIFSISVPLTDTQKVFVALVVIVCFTAIGWDIVSYFKSQPKKCKSETQIIEYMHRWISSGGRVAIFTRDMSWVTDNVRSLLKQKAERHELVVCLPKEIALTSELKALGAEIYTYHELQYDPASRFTIVRKDKMDSQVAVGWQKNGVHTVVEYSNNGDNPVFALATDLVAVIERNFKSKVL